MHKYFILGLMSLATSLSLVYATDHIDSPFEKVKTTDITDLYAFSQQSEGKNKLVIAMGVEMYAKKKTRFAEDVQYSFVIRRAMLEGFGKDFKIQTGEEFQLVCTFNTHRGSSKLQDAHCVVYNNSQQEIARASNVLNDLNGGSNPSIRLFAGHRADPFFFDIVRVRMERKRHSSYHDTGFPFPGIIAKNFLDKANILAIVLEIDTEAVFGVSDNTLFAVACHTRRESFQGGSSSLVNVDRAGRPEVANFVMAQFTTINHHYNKIKRQWNAEETFDIRTEKTKLYRETIEAGLKNLDLKDPGLGTDGQDWTYPHPFTEILLDDYLLVDIAKSGNVDSTNYLEIERSRILGQEHTSCGGRTPNEDFVDTMLTLFINGPKRTTPIRGDGIYKQPRPAPNTFPYLAKPH